MNAVVNGLRDMRTFELVASVMKSGIILSLYDLCGASCLETRLSLLLCLDMYYSVRLKFVQVNIKYY